MVDQETRRQDGKITSAEEFKEYLDAVYPQVCENFHVEDLPEKPKVITAEEAKGRGEDITKDIGSYYAVFSPDLEVFILDEYGLRRNFGEDEIRPSAVGEEAAHFLRDKKGLADDNPKYISVEEFFGRLGRRIVAENFDETVGEPRVGLRWTHPISETKEEFRDKLIKKAQKAAEEGLYFENFFYEAWSRIAHYAGYKTADENYPEALEDKNLISRGSKEVWEEYNMLKKEYEGLKKAANFEV